MQVPVAEAAGATGNLIIIMGGIGALLAPVVASIVAAKRKTGKDTETVGQNVEARVVSATVADAQAIRDLVTASNTLCRSVESLNHTIDRMDTTMRSDALTSRIDTTAIVEANDQIVKRIIELARTIDRAMMMLRLMAPPGKMPPEMESLFDQMK